MISLLLYRLLSGPAWLLLWLLSRFHGRIRENLEARHGWREELAKAMGQLPEKDRVWIHCASMGEFEAVRPLARLLKAEGRPVLISFFSTSGPRHVSQIPEADHFCYLPFDTPRAAKAFIRITKPAIALVSKHDLWPNHLIAAKATGAKLAFINANFHEKSRLANPLLASFHRALLGQFDLICTVSDAMANRFNSLLKGRVKLVNTGDSRFDRVVERALAADSDQLLPADFMKGGRVIVLGSCWQPDEELVLPQLAALSREFADLRVLLVPHEPSNAALERLEGLLGRLSIKSRRLAELPLAADESMPRAIIIDRVGLLAGLYRGAWLAWVGGGLTTGVHSVIEPAAHGLPVLFGPRHHVAQEAQDLLKVGAAASFSQPEELSTFLRELLQKPDVHGKMATAASQLVQASRGASERIHACLFA